MTASLRPTPGSTAVATGLLAFVGIGAASALYGPTLPVLSERYGLEPAAAGLVLAAHGTGAFIGVAACLLPQVEARMRFRPAFALVMVGLGAVLIAAGLPWPMPLVGALSIGFGYGLLTVGFNGLFSRAFGNRSASMVNLLNAVFGIGAMVAPIVFVASGGSPAVAFGMLAALTLILAPRALAVDDRSQTAPLAHAGGPTTKDATRRSALPMVLMFFAVGVEASVVGWGPTILIARGAEPLEAATAASWFFAVFLASRMIAVPLASIVSYRALAIGAMGVLLACCLLAALTDQPAFWFAAMGVGGVVFPNAFGWLSRLLDTVPGGDARVVVSALAGAALIPPALGVASGFIGEGALFGAIAALIAVTVVVALAVRPSP